MRYRDGKPRYLSAVLRFKNAINKDLAFLAKVGVFNCPIASLLEDSLSVLSPSGYLRTPLMSYRLAAT